MWHLAQVREGAVLGANCIVGRGACVGSGVRLGDNVKVQNYALMCQPVLLGDRGPGQAAAFRNDHLPCVVSRDGSMDCGPSRDLGWHRRLDAKPSHKVPDHGGRDPDRIFAGRGLPAEVRR